MINVLEKKKREAEKNRKIGSMEIFMASEVKLI